MGDPDRRRFLKIATCAIGGGVGVVSVAPVLRVVLDPTSKETVTSPSAPLDLGSAARFQLGAGPTRVEVIAPLVKDGWTAAQHVVLGAAWIRRTGPDIIDARSAVCPHLGCAVGFDLAQNNFLCPCHDSRFGLDGSVLSGPSERGLDQLPVSIGADGKLMLTWERYKTGQKTKERA